MTYYPSTSYAEKYFTCFTDLLGAQWRISIEAPGFTGTPIGLTPSADPFVISGSGSEDQTECLLGSTATLRLFCNAGESALFHDIHPTDINNRRITARRGNTLIFQGFIAMDTYTQPLDDSTYEMEFTCLSFLSFAKILPLPQYGTWNWTTEPVDVAGVLRYLVSLSGLDISMLYTNQGNYIDFDNIEDNHDWTSSECHVSYFYDWGVIPCQPSTIGNVLETLFYPYGHLRDHGQFLTCMMPNKNKTLYALDLSATATTNTLTNSGTLLTQQLSDLDSMSTSNTITLLLPPSGVDFSRKVKNDNIIFEISDLLLRDSYRTNLNKNTLDGTTSKYHAGDGYTIYADLINSSKLKYSSVFTGGIPIGNDRSWARVARVDNAGNNGTFVQTSIVQSLALWFKDKNVTKTLPLKRRVRSSLGYNSIKLTTSATLLAGKNTGYDTRYTVRIKQGDKCLGKSGNTYTWLDYDHWMDSESEMMYKNKESWVIFNEERSDNERSTTQLEISVKSMETGDTFDGTFYLTAKLEYVPDPYNTMLPDGTLTTINRTLAESNAYNNRIISCNGGGDAISVSFPTLCGDIFSAINGSAEVPVRSFCNATNLIDIKPRTMLDYESVRLPLPLSPTPDSPIESIVAYELFKDGDTTYIPQSVGLNARDATLKLKLISTNL